MTRLVALVSMLFLVCGCSSTAPQSWVVQHGGLGNGPELERASLIASRFGSLTDLPVQAHVLNSGDPAAWSWPDRDVYVTVGLMNLLNDDELAAVIGHEMGHLFKHDPHSNNLSLTGSQAGLDVESAADQASLRLLQAANLPPTALRSALHKLLQAKAFNPEMRHSIEARAARLP